MRLRSRAGAPHQHDAIARSCVPLREQLCSRTLRQLLQLSVREAVGVVAVAAVAAHPAVEHLKVVGSNRWTGDRRVSARKGERGGRGLLRRRLLGARDDKTELDGCRGRGG